MEHTHRKTFGRNTSRLPEGNIDRNIAPPRAMPAPRVEDFVAYPSRWRLTLLALVCVLFVIAGLWMIGLFGPVSDRSRIIFLGWSFIIIFGSCFIAAVKRFTDSSEELRIGPAGVRSRLWSDKTIPWNEITDVTVWSYNGSKSIMLHLRDPSRFPGRGIRGLLSKAGRSLVDGDISISMGGNDRSLNEAIDAIKRFRSS